MKKPPQAERREMTRRSAAETKSALPSADTPDRASDPQKHAKSHSWIISHPSVGWQEVNRQGVTQMTLLTRKEAVAHLGISPDWR